jgi:dihydroorotase
VYSEGLIHNGAILINNGIFEEVIYAPTKKDFELLIEKNVDSNDLDCENRLILPGIIDIHSHLRDLGQSEKEAFNTGTKAAAYSGITTVFNMPNTKPPAINEKQIKIWMGRARNDIFVNVGFIAGVPSRINETEIKKIIKLGIIGFKIYPSSPLSDIDWKKSKNLQKLLSISSIHQIPIFIHAAYPISEVEKKSIIEKLNIKSHSILKIHDRLNPVNLEDEYISFVIKNYHKFISDKNLNPKKFPIIHFCHVSSKAAYLCIQRSLKSNKDLKISFEVTPHHLLLSNEILLENDNYGKVLPPLREKNHSKFLFNELKNGNIPLIGTDHAPHTLKDKSQEYLDAPSGFPGFESYPLVLLDKVFDYKLSLEMLIKASSENPAKQFNLKKKGVIKEGYDADFMIVDKIPKFSIKSENFRTKAKFTPFENYLSSVQIWKVFLKGKQINIEDVTPKGKIIKANYKV